MTEELYEIGDVFERPKTGDRMIIINCRKNSTALTYYQTLEMKKRGPYIVSWHNDALGIEVREGFIKKIGHIDISILENEKRRTK